VQTAILKNAFYRVRHWGWVYGTKGVVARKSFGTTGLNILNSTVLWGYLAIYLVHRSRYSDWLRAGRPRGRNSSPGRVKNFLFSTSSIPALRFTQLPIQWVRGLFSPGIKQPESEADHSPPASAEVKKMGIYTSTSPHFFMAWCLIS
jgi:hypothetical protein